MYRSTRFGELMKGLSRDAFEKIVSDHQADKYSKGFRSWDQLMVMIYAQLSGCKSLRELEAGFNSQALYYYPLGRDGLKRSTLADANAKRSSEVFAKLCGQLLGQAHRQVKGELKDLLYLLDATGIGLKGLGYDQWTKANRTRRTQGLKVHLMLAPTAGIPVYATITAPTVNDIEEGRKVPLEAGATYVFDKGYCDYNWWYEIDQWQAIFVTRFKKNAGIKWIKQRWIPKEAQGIILEDSIVQFKNKRPGGHRLNHYYGTPLRRIVVDRPDKDRPLMIATNDFERSAQELAALYKARWAIELYFKWLKQNLNIKQFLGRSENAVKIQIYTALITYLLVQFYCKRHGFKQSLKLCVLIIRLGLFERPEIKRISIGKRRYGEREYQCT